MAFRPSASFENDEPRVCVVSLRSLRRSVSRACGNEFEDVIASIDKVDLVVPTQSLVSKAGYRALRTLSRVTPVARYVGPGTHSRLGAEKYDLLIFVAQFANDLIFLNDTDHWRQRSRFAVLYLEEIWNDRIKRLGLRKDLFKPFDLILCNCAGSVERLAQVTGRPVEYVPPGVDTLTFAPDPDGNDRPISICNIGRRSQVTHDALLRFARDSGRFYYYDTTYGFADASTRSANEHRFLMANLCKRSSFFVANKAKFDRGKETHGQEEIGFRFFEGLAAGAVLLGDPPKTSAFEEHLGWTDSVTRIPFDCPEIVDILQQLEGQPERLAAIRSRNVRNCIRRHDWLHRWAMILQRAGLNEDAKMTTRRAQLSRLAERFEEGATATAGSGAQEHDPEKWEPVFGSDHARTTR